MLNALDDQQSHPFFMCAKNVNTHEIIPHNNPFNPKKKLHHFTEPQFETIFL